MPCLPRNEPRVEREANGAPHLVLFELSGDARGLRRSSARLGNQPTAFLKVTSYPDFLKPADSYVLSAASPEVPTWATVAPAFRRANRASVTTALPRPRLRWPGWVPTGSRRPVRLWSSIHAVQNATIAPSLVLTTRSNLARLGMARFDELARKAWWSDPTVQMPLDGPRPARSHPNQILNRCSIPVEVRQVR
jgi:hypothetical protein